MRKTGDFRVQMKTSRYVVLGIAAIAGILLFFLVRGLIAGKATTEATASATPAPPPVATAHVLVAARDIKAGNHLSEEDLRWQEWPANMVVPVYITDQPVETAAAPQPAAGTEDTAAKAEQTGSDIAATAQRLIGPNAKTALVGAVAREDINANEPILEAKVVRADQGGFMAVMLSPGMRAIAVPVSVDNTAGGFILPGDRVDILVTHQTPRTGGGTLDSVQPVLRNIRILAIDQQVKTDDKQNIIGATATLEVTPVDGQALILAKASGTLSLMLRSYADASGPSGVVTAAPVGGGDGSVRVFRNGQPTEVLVSR